MNEDSDGERVISTGLGHLEEIIAPAQAQREAEDAGLHLGRGSNNAKTALYSQLLQLSDDGISLAQDAGDEERTEVKATGQSETESPGQQQGTKKKSDSSNSKSNSNSNNDKKGNEEGSRLRDTLGGKDKLHPQAPSVDVMRDDFLLGDFEATSIAAIVTDGSAEAVLFFVREDAGVFGSLALQKNAEGESFDVAIHEIATDLVAPSKVMVVESRVYVLERGECLPDLRGRREGGREGGKGGTVCGGTCEKERERERKRERLSALRCSTPNSRNSSTIAVRSITNHTANLLTRPTFTTQRTHLRL